METFYNNHKSPSLLKLDKSLLSETKGLITTSFKELLNYLWNRKCNKKFFSKSVANFIF